MLSYISIAVATLSILISFTTLYLSYLRKPKLSASVGPHVLICYDNNGLTITVPVTLANKAPKVGIVRRCSLTINRKDGREEYYYMEWSSFRKLTDDGSTWVQEGTAHVIPVLGHSTETKYIKYEWDYDSKPELTLEEGVYNLRFDFWDDQNEPFTNVSHELKVNSKEAARVQRSRELNNEKGMSKITYFSLDRDTTKNRKMTKKEMKALLS